MEKSLNLLIQEFKEDLVGLINSAKIPTSVKQMAVGEVLNTLARVNAMEIQSELDKLHKEEGEPDGQIIQ